MASDLSIHPGPLPLAAGRQDASGTPVMAHQQGTPVQFSSDPAQRLRNFRHGSPRLRHGSGNVEDNVHDTLMSLRERAEGTRSCYGTCYRE